MPQRPGQSRYRARARSQGRSEKSPSIALLRLLLLLLLLLLVAGRALDPVPIFPMSCRRSATCSNMVRETGKLQIWASQGGTHSQRHGRFTAAPMLPCRLMISFCLCSPLTPTAGFGSQSRPGLAASVKVRMLLRGRMGQYGYHDVRIPIRETRDDGNATRGCFQQPGLVCALTNECRWGWHSCYS